MHSLPQGPAVCFTLNEREKGLEPRWQGGRLATRMHQHDTSTSSIQINNQILNVNNINQTLIIASHRSKISSMENVGGPAGRMPTLLRHRLLELGAGCARATMSYLSRHAAADTSS